MVGEFAAKRGMTEITAEYIIEAKERLMKQILTHIGGIANYWLLS